MPASEPPPPGRVLRGMEAADAVRAPDALPAALASDAELLARIVDGDRPAFRLLYLRYHARLYRFVLRLIHRPELTEEVVNDVMLTVWQKADQFRGDAAVATWLFGIAYRRGLKTLRRWPLPVDPAARPESADPAAVPERAVDQDLEAVRLQRGLAQLSPEHRAVVELTYFFGHSCAEVAAIVNCPVNTVKTRLFHARRRLQDWLMENANNA